MLLAFLDFFQIMLASLHYVFVYNIAHLSKVLIFISSSVFA